MLVLTQYATRLVLLWSIDNFPLLFHINYLDVGYIAVSI